MMASCWKPLHNVNNGCPHRKQPSKCSQTVIVCKRVDSAASKLHQEAAAQEKSAVHQLSIQDRSHDAQHHGCQGVSTAAVVCVWKVMQTKWWRALVQPISTNSAHAWGAGSDRHAIHGLQTVCVGPGPAFWASLRLQACVVLKCSSQPPPAVHHRWDRPIPHQTPHRQPTPPMVCSHPPRLSSRPPCRPAPSPIPRSG